MERLDTPMKPGAWLKNLVRQQIFIPLAALLILVIFNLIADYISSRYRQVGEASL